MSKGKSKDKKKLGFQFGWSIKVEDGELKTDVKVKGEVPDSLREFVAKTTETLHKGTHEVMKGAREIVDDLQNELHEAATGKKREAAKPSDDAQATSENSGPQSPPRTSRKTAAKKKTASKKATRKKTASKKKTAKKASSRRRSVKASSKKSD